MRLPIPTWAIVATGLVLNVAAALMTNFVIDDLGEKATAVAERQTNNNQLIQLSWQQADALERRREAILVVLALTPADIRVSESVAVTLLDAFTDMNDTPLTRENMPSIMAKINDQQDLLRNKIDTLYLDNLQMAENQYEFNRQISAYRNLALFLQVFGLALIMARDLNRKQD
ncbi:hypothetical protein [Enterovibrio baiacu]|uniref:hypothetical protein n=1 Tax=Enterovibrio baiacu TaxID=2491023 RepID=UPI003D0FA72E